MDWKANITLDYTDVVYITEDITLRDLFDEDLL